MPAASANRAGALSCRACSVIPLTWPDLFASDMETCKHVSASLGSVVIPATERESPARAGLRDGIGLHISLLHTHPDVSR